MSTPTLLIEDGFKSDPTVALSATTWTDTTGFAQTFRLRTGRSSELDDFTAGSQSRQLDNKDRRFDPTYTQVNYLNLPGVDDANASTPDAAALDIAGDIDVRWFGRADDWTPASIQRFLAKAGISATAGGYTLRLNTDGTIGLQWSDGTSGFSTISTVAVAFADGTDGAVRATMDVDDGAGNRVITFYTSTDGGETWTQLGATVTTAGTTSIGDATADLKVGTTLAGNQPFAGRCYTIEARDGIDGTVVANPDFRDQLGGPSSFTDSTGKIWTVGGAATIADISYVPYVKPMRRVRVRATHNAVTYDLWSGFTTGWPQTYEPPNASNITVGGVDAFEVLANVAAPSSVYAVEVANSEPRGWWRLGETSDSVWADASGNGNDAEVSLDLKSAATGGLGSFESDGAANLDENRHGRTVSKAHRVVTNPFTLEWIMAFQGEEPVGGQTKHHIVFAQGLSPGTGLKVAIFRGATLDNYEVEVLIGALDRSVLFRPPKSSEPQHVVIVGGPGSSNVDLYINGVEVAAFSSAAGATIPAWEANLSIGGPPGFSGDPDLVDQDALFKGTLDEIAHYNVALSSATIATHYEALTAPWDGDTSGERLGRILDVIGWPATDRVIDTGQSILGPEPLGGSALDALKRVAAAEDGRLFIDGDGKVTFLNRHHTLLDTTIVATWGDDGAAGELPYSTDGFEIKNDRDLIRNAASGHRPGGATQTHEDPTSSASFTRRDFSVGEVAVRNDSELRNRLEYTVDKYKDPVTRIESIVIHPAKAPSPPATWTSNQLWAAALGAKIGQRHRVKRRPQSVGDAIDLEVIVEGVEHRVGTSVQGAIADWETVLYLSPADTKKYWVLGTSELGVDTRLGY